MRKGIENKALLQLTCYITKMKLRTSKEFSSHPLIPQIIFKNFIKFRAAIFFLDFLVGAGHFLNSN